MRSIQNSKKKLVIIQYLLLINLTNLCCYIFQILVSESLVKGCTFPSFLQKLHSFLL